jgi:hypothetical protein
MGEMIRRIVVLFGCACAASMLLAACGGAHSDDPPEVPEGRKVVEAPIADLNLISTGERPPRYQVGIISGLPNSCAEFHDARITGNTGTLITVSITNTVPEDPNAVCAEVYDTHSSVLELGSDYTPGTTYTVKVNAGEVKFTPQ